MLNLDDLHEYFIKFGEIIEIRVIKDKIDNIPKGFGFVLFKDKHALKKVLEKGLTHIVNGCKVIKRYKTFF